MLGHKSNDWASEVSPEPYCENMVRSSRYIAIRKSHSPHVTADKSAARLEGFCNCGLLNNPCCFIESHAPQLNATNGKSAQHDESFHSDYST